MMMGGALTCGFATICGFAGGATVACGGGRWYGRRFATHTRTSSARNRLTLPPGFTAKDDSLPKRLLTEACKTGPAKGKVNMLADMLPKYYAARGWDKEGKPTADTRKRLGL